MDLKEAQKYAEDVSLYLLQHVSATDYAPSQKDEVLICLALACTDLTDEIKKLKAQQAVGGFYE